MLSKRHRWKCHPACQQIFQCSLMVFVGMGLAIVLLAGCGGSNQLETAKASGRVLLDGKPLRRGSVMFVPLQGRAAKGEIQPDGTFVLGTYQNGDGAIVGTHKAAILVLRADIDRKLGPEQDKPIMDIPPHYATADESGLTYEVKPDQSNEFTLELKSK